MRNVPQHTVLIDSADPHRLDSWSATLRRTECLPLEAATVREAREWVHAVCPDLVLSDAALPDGRAIAFLHDLRGVRALERVPVVVRGEVTASERRYVDRDPHAQVQQVDDPHALIALVEEILHSA
jgi:DNA-binding NtrC family response regulator